MHYLDNSATTAPSEKARAAFVRALEIWGNPSSVYSLGRDAHSLLESSRQSVLKALGAKKNNGDLLIFTSSGTEANNLAITGCAFSKERRPSPSGSLGTVIMGMGEHPSVENPVLRLKKHGFTVEGIPTKSGMLDLGYLEEVLSNAVSPVVLAAFMLVNNETGALYDVSSASALVKRYFPDASVHCDAVQAFMKTPFSPSSIGADTVTISAHKIHAPRGAGALYVSKSIITRKNLVPVTLGGGQENGFRSGTENICAISAFAAAAEDSLEHFDENVERTAFLRERLDSELLSVCPEIRFNRPSGNSVCDICSLIVPGVRSETMLNFLSANGIYISAGSACSARSKKRSGALEAFGTSADDADSTLRISLSYTNTEEDISALTSALRQGLDRLAKKKGQ